MSRGRRAGGVSLAVAVAAFVAGGLAGWTLRGGAPRPMRVVADAVLPPGAPAARPVATSGGETDGDAGDPIRVLQRRRLLVPIDGARPDEWTGDFEQPRDAGRRAHQAVDILAPRNTPVRAVDDGTIAKLFESRAGGHTIYQFDPAGRFCYYYAHLERYAEGLHDGQAVSRGEVIGFVGTSGNAPAGTPHLHFAISVLGPDRRWWEGEPVDPARAFRQ